MEKVKRSRNISESIRLLAQQPFSITINGQCMQPVLRNNSLVSVQSKTTYWPGDILVFEAHPGTLSSHRLMGAMARFSEPDSASRVMLHYLTKADNTNQPDGWVTRDQIIGKVLIDIPMKTRLNCLVWFSRYLTSALYQRLTHFRLRPGRSRPR